MVLVLPFFILSDFYNELTYFAIDENLNSKHLASGVMKCMNLVQLYQTFKVLFQMLYVFNFYVAFINKEFFALLEKITAFHFEQNRGQFLVVNILQSFK